MRKLVCAALLLTGSTVMAQQATPAQDATKMKLAVPNDAKIEALANDLHAISRITSFPDSREPRQIVLAILDENIAALRGPRADGTYEWASLQREEGGRATSEKSIEQVSTQETLATITVTAPDAYRAEVVVPRKRNAFQANNRIYVRNLIVEGTGFDGKTMRQDIPVNAWISPGDTRGEALPAIFKSAKVTAELGVESGDKKGTATLAVLQAKLMDSPNSPYYPAVLRLVNGRADVVDKNVSFGQLRSRADEALLMLPGELEKRTAAQLKADEERKALAAAGTTKGAIAMGDATPDVTHELQEIARMMTGTLQEQGDARTRLDTLITTLSPPAAVNAPATTPK